MEYAPYETSATSRPGAESFGETVPPWFEDDGADFNPSWISEEEAKDCELAWLIERLEIDGPSHERE